MRLMITHEEPGGGFCTFESPPDTHLEVPSVTELAIAWQKYHGDSEIISLDEHMLGICERPTEKPSVIISLDLCEVLRETGPSLTRIYTPDASAYAHDYGSYYGDELLGGNTQQAREALLPHLMHTEQVLPVPFSAAIAAFMQRWRHHGAYIVANTSTLPRCELSTVSFLSKHYPRTTQGVLLPRNHDGRGTVTKSSILQHMKEKITDSTGFDLMHTPTLAIEDAYHHATAYIEDREDTHVFMPAYSWNEPLEDDTDITRVQQQFGTLDTFIAVDEYLISCGIVK